MKTTNYADRDSQIKLWRAKVDEAMNETYEFDDGCKIKDRNAQLGEINETYSFAIRMLEDVTGWYLPKYPLYLDNERISKNTMRGICKEIGVVQE